MFLFLYLASFAEVPVRPRFLILNFRHLENCTHVFLSMMISMFRSRNVVSAFENMNENVDFILPTMTQPYDFNKCRLVVVMLCLLFCVITLSRVNMVWIFSCRFMVSLSNADCCYCMRLRYSVSDYGKLWCSAF